jgi:hypothetical protein
MPTSAAHSFCSHSEIKKSERVLIFAIFLITVLKATAGVAPGLGKGWEERLEPPICLTQRTAVGIGLAVSTARPPALVALVGLAGWVVYRRISE